MKVSVLQDKLQKALEKVLGVVEPRNTLPVLANVILSVEDARLVIGGTNLECSVIAYVGAKIDLEGPPITLPGKTLLELVSKLSDKERVDISVNYETQTATIKCGTARSQLKGIDATEFPLLPVMERTDFEMTAKSLRTAINHAMPCAAKEDSRPILMGLHLVSDGNKLNIVSADGYRLYVNVMELDMPAPAFDVVLPSKPLKLLAKLLKDNKGNVGIQISGEHDIWMFETNHTVISTMMLEGKFPDVTTIIPRTYNTQVVLYSADFFNAIERGQVFGKDSAYSMKMEVAPPKGPGEPGAVMLTGYSAERGMLEGSLDATVSGEPLTVSFNSKYMLDIPFEDERLVLESNGHDKAIVMRPENTDNEVYVMMPMGVNR